MITYSTRLNIFSINIIKNNLLEFYIKIKNNYFLNHKALYTFSII